MSGDRMRIGGFQIRDTTTVAMTRFLQKRIADGRKVAIGFANHHFVTTCQTLRCERLGKQQLILVNDGIGVQIAALLRFGRPFGENMNGTDFVPRFLSGVAHPCSVYLIGGRREVIRRAAETIIGFPRCQVVGFCDGFSLWQHEATVLADIAETRPDVLLVGLGNPLQERWIIEHFHELDAKVIIGVGALFEWLTGIRRRAPRLVRLARLEWVYRLMLEPRRLLRRYTIDAITFFALVVRGDAYVETRDGAE